MKKVVLINTVLYGSTGTIVRQLKKTAEENGMEAYTVTAYARNDSTERDDHDLVIGTYLDRYLHIFLSRITGYSGLFSYFATKRILYKLKAIKPDIIHLHNLHNAYINLPLLFDYIKTNNIKTIWTLHDCWAFTGRCPHFEMQRCDKWKTGCKHCEYPPKDYPISFIDKSSKMWSLKNKIFNGVKDMTLVAPSEWLADLIKQSFLSTYPVRVINNGIDLTVFKPTTGRVGESLKEEGKYIVLGVAMDWGVRKGLDVFVELSKRLEYEYRIVLVGTTDSIERQLKGYGITCIRKTNSQKELAEIYTAADVFFNPTREEVLGLVNIEALACGTPVITFDSGGSPECINADCGQVIDCDSEIEIIKNTLNKIICRKISANTCRNAVCAFDKNEMSRRIIELYNEQA